MKVLNIVSLLVLILGGLNWLAVGLFEYDVVSEVFDGSDSVGAKIVYIVVGVAALYSLSFFSKVSAED
ncbi:MULTISPECIES: DUF378 domain-containing protein [Paenibacillus]|uniref:DUF378 domain-containing protein n=1 Tax=Paenibacillus lignilyticus TaxID=1172615 RepID=A0ABS5CN27_9BACL|nr:MULTISPECIES: DUF378 domain-containing protein [Paenibacillus]MBP3967274.1 DUF378 domain-containing protein [Paenibacillus lignilyticus]SDX54910.1 hypothetical protein SAMN05518855_101637 [Paenibacillus sp. CF384]SFT27385.1 hypothetical protein SAMN05428962_6128 [Paenibacillus sp. BC26]